MSPADLRRDDGAYAQITPADAVVGLVELLRTRHASNCGCVNVLELDGCEYSATASLPMPKATSATILGDLLVVLIPIYSARLMADHDGFLQSIPAPFPYLH